MLIKYLLFNSDRTVFFKVVEQDESLRKGDCNHNDITWFTSNKHGIKIMSAGRPALEFEWVYIRGTDRSSDNKMVFYVCRSPQEAKEMVDSINATFKLWMDYIKEMKEETSDVQI